MSLVLAAPCVFLAAATLGPVAAAAASLLFSSVVFWGMVAKQIFHRRTQDDDRSTLGRRELTEWLRAKLASPSEQKRLATMAISVELARSFSMESDTFLNPSILAQIEMQLRKALRQDDIVVRGDVADFLVGLSRLRAPQAETLEKLAERLQHQVQVPMDVDGEQARPRLTIGICSSRISGLTDAQSLIEAAEDAQEAAALIGPGSRVTHNLTKAQSADSMLLAELNAALENGQITAWYQPQLSTETGDVSGFEALARWEHPTRGVISPASFLPLIDQAGLSRRLAKVILTHALSALRTWDRAALGIPGVGVNFSADELRDPSLSDFLRWELDRFELDPSRLVVEVLESVISESHDDVVARNLRGIASMGCRIDLDDFGTGFTSIINIPRFDVSRIKIDRKLVTNAATDKSQRDLIAAILSMSEHLRVETLGEGVESKEEQLALAQLGCGHVQGFAIARPMPLGDTLAWTLDHRASLEDAKSVALRSSAKGQKSG